MDRFKEQTYRNDLIIGIEHEVGCLLTNIGVTTIFELLDRVYMSCLTVDNLQLIYGVNLQISI